MPTTKYKSKMKDKNIVWLEGLIGDDFKYAKTKECKEFCTFTLCLNSYLKELADSTEQMHNNTFIRITAYDKKLLEYLKRVRAHRGQRVSIMGRLSSYKSEYKGVELIQLSVVVRDISVIQTKKFKSDNNIKDNEDGNKEKENLHESAH